MSIWCRVCGKTTFNEKLCDHCGKIPIAQQKDESKNYSLPKSKKARIVYGKPKQKSISDDFLDNSPKKIFKEKTKKDRGDEYEAYIAKYYRRLGYFVIEHGKEKGLKDGGIDLIAEKDNKVILIQCKDWNENNSHKIDHKDIKVLRIDANDFLEKNTKYENYKIKLRYTLSGNFLHKSAERHMEECREDIDYEIIKPNYREEESKPDYSKQAFKHKKIKTKYMVPCEVCGNRIAVKATSCPYCGDTKSKNLFWKIVKIIAIVIAALFILKVILTSIGIAIFSNSLDNASKELNKSNQKMIKQINDIKSPIINFTKTQQNNKQKEAKLDKKETKTGPLTRYLTNTQTDKEKCNHKWWEYYKKSAHTISEIEKENRNIKIKLQKHKINYSLILKQRVRNIKINEKELRKKSCSEAYFKQLMQKEKRIKEVKNENEILKELMKRNDINNIITIYQK